MEIYSGVEPMYLTMYLNVPFDNTYKDHPFFSDEFSVDGERIGELDSSGFLDIYANDQKTIYKFPRWVKTEPINFDYNNQLTTSLVVEIDELHTEYTASNYCMIKSSNGNHKYYYFIKNITQRNANTYELSLELDVIMTYDDEILDGLKEKPVMTRRKHCHRFGSNKSQTPSQYPFVCPELTIKDTDIKFEANINENNNIVNLDNTSTGNPLSIVEGWNIYSSSDTEGGTGDIVDYHSPLRTQVLPSQGYVRIVYGTESVPVAQRIIDCGSINKREYVEPNTQCIKYSSYPPFLCFFDEVAKGEIFVDGEIRNGYIFYLHTDNQYIVPNSVQYENQGQTIPVLLRFKISMRMPETTGFRNMRYQKVSFNYPAQNPELDYFIITEQPYESSKHKYNDITLNSYASNVSSSMGELVNKTYEPRLFVEPLRKRYLYSQSGGKLELNISPILQNIRSTNTIKISPYAFTNNYPNDNTISIFCESDDTQHYLTRNKYENVGLNTTPSYVVPVGENAWKNWTTTQASSYASGKIMKAITSIISIVGGVAITAGTGGSGSVLGGTMIAGGVAGLGSIPVEAISNYTDLNNTPDTYSNIGGSFIRDNIISSYVCSGNNILNTSNLVFVERYISKAQEEIAYDHFYHHGYLVNKMCYFNSELIYDVSTLNDNHLFSRKVFNYIQLDDQIGYKIDANIPFVIKNKISEIFNAGITLWTFFAESGEDTYGLWNRNGTTWRQVDKYYLKDLYENIETEWEE